MPATRTPAPPGSVREEGERPLFADTLPKEYDDKLIRNFGEMLDYKDKHGRRDLGWNQFFADVKRYRDPRAQVNIPSPLTINLVAPKGKSSEVKIHREES